MKKLLNILFFVPLFSIGQSDESIFAFQKSIPSDLGVPIRLPKPGYNPDFDINQIAGYAAKQRVLVVASDLLYKKIFHDFRFTKDSLAASGRDSTDWYYQWMVQHLADSLPVIDFSRKELVLYSACGQCLAFCHHSKGETSCHRNACDFMITWFLRDKVPDLVRKVSMD